MIPASSAQIKERPRQRVQNLVVCDRAWFRVQRGHAPGLVRVAAWNGPASPAVSHGRVTAHGLCVGFEAGQARQCMLDTLLMPPCCPRRQLTYGGERRWAASARGARGARGLRGAGWASDEDNISHRGQYLSPPAAGAAALRRGAIRAWAGGGRRRREGWLQTTHKQAPDRKAPKDGRQTDGRQRERRQTDGRQTEGRQRDGRQTAGRQRDGRHTSKRHTASRVAWSPPPACPARAGQ